MLMETVSNISTRKELYFLFSILSVDYTIGFKYKWRLYSGNTGVYAERNDIKHSKLSLGVKGAPDDDFLQEVARRARDKRETEKWCQHCGAPSQDDKPLKKCAKCRIAPYLL